MKASVFTKQLTAAVANNIAASQSLAGVGNLLINGSAASGGVATLDTQRRIIITSAGDDSGLTWTVIGTDDYAAPIKDIFAGANGVATANLNFKTVTSIFGSAATASTVTVGTNGVGSTPWQLFADTIETPNADIYMQLQSGTGTATFEYTQNQFLPPVGVQASITNGPATVNPIALPHPDLQSLTASKDGSVNFGIHGWRLTINAGTGIWQCTTRQSGLASP